MDPTVGNVQTIRTAKNTVLRERRERIISWTSKSVGPTVIRSRLQFDELIRD